jgi:cytochrome c biogenesis protein
VLLSRLGTAAWRLLTDVRFAVVLIALLALAGLVGILVRQFPVTAADDPARYAVEFAAVRTAWQGLAPLGLSIGPALADAFDALGLFSVFSTPWFLVLMTVLTISIVCCTLDRTPRLWRTAHDVRVVQADAFYDPERAQRAVIEVPTGAAVAGASAASAPTAGGAPAASAPTATADATTAAQPTILAAVQSAFRERHLRRQRVAESESVTYVYGDRNQYQKLATLLTHAGLVLFLLGGAVTVAVGFETVVFVGEGQSAPVRPIGTPGNLLVKVHDFESPRRDDGSFADFSTDISIFRDGDEVARKVIRVNDPLTVDGFVFHQNTFGPSADLVIRDASGELVWDGPLLLDDEIVGRPQGFMTIPGADVGLVAALSEGSDGSPQLAMQGIGPTEPGGTDNPTLFLVSVPLGVATDPQVTAGHSIAWTGVGAWTGMVVKNDPGQAVIWIAFALLIGGLVLTFYFPRRRAWARIDGSRIGLAFLADPTVDRDGEFRRLADAVARASSSTTTTATSPATSAARTVQERADLERAVQAPPEPMGPDRPGSASRA